MTLTLFADGCQPGVDLTVEIALTSATGPAGIWNTALWDAALWGPDVVWTNVSAWVRAVETPDSHLDRRMRSWQSSQCTVVLSNRDGRFSPDNLTGPYVAAGVSGIRPGCLIRATATYSGVTYPLWCGYVTSWDEGWALHAPQDGDAYMTVSAIDVWGKLASAKGHAVAPVGAGDTFAARVARLLTAAGYVGSMTLDTGVTTMQATDMSDERVTEIVKAAQSEGGMVYPEPDGTIHAAGRYGLVNDTRSTTVQAVFGDGAGEIPWTDIDRAPLSDAAVVNDAVYKRDGGAEQRFVDPVSVALYGTHSEPDTSDDLMCETDAQVVALAQWAVLTGASPEARIDGLTFRPRCDLPALAPVFLGLKVRDLVTVMVRPPSSTGHVMQRACFVAGVAHTIEENDWTVRVVLASANTHVQYANSRWDVGLWGASDVDPAAARWFV